MFGQTFSPPDLITLLILSFLEILLSSDNVVVLATLTKKLPERLRQKALYIGFVSAFVLRLAAILCVSFLVKFLWFQLLGSVYLLYLSISYLFKKDKHEKMGVKAKTSFIKTVVMIELFDLIFALDSIIAGVAFITPSTGIVYSKLWIVYAGGMIGAFAIRYAALLFTFLMNLFPRLEHAAYILIGWIGLKLFITATSLQFPYFTLCFWAGLVSLLLFGFSNKRKNG